MASIDEYKKFVNSAPESIREFRTIEFFHPDFISVQRFVKDFQDVNLTLEAAAPRDPSSTVAFLAASINLNEPGENGNIDQVLTVDMGAVGNQINSLIDSIVDNFTPIEMIYRKYISSDLTSPVLVLTLSVAAVNFKGYEGVSLSGEDINFVTKRAGEIYTLERFTTLRNL